LPAPQRSRGQGQHTLVLPRTTAEQELATIWRGLLGVPEVGIHDNFFELGGDSILSLQVVSRARQAGLHLTTRDLFQHPTLADWAAAAGQVRASDAEQGLVSGPVPLTPVQRWFFAQQPLAAEHFNQAVLLEVRQRLDATLLEQAVQRLLHHHDALR